MGRYYAVHRPADAGNQEPKMARKIHTTNIDFFRVWVRTDDNHAFLKDVVTREEADKYASRINRADENVYVTIYKCHDVEMVLA
jgi:hypothetical protein